jgi:hypothetical protein
MALHIRSTIYPYHTPHYTKHKTHYSPTPPTSTHPHDSPSYLLQYTPCSHHLSYNKTQHTSQKHSFVVFIHILLHTSFTNNHPMDEPNPTPNHDPNPTDPIPSTTPFPLHANAAPRHALSLLATTTLWPQHHPQPSSPSSPRHEPLTASTPTQQPLEPNFASRCNTSNDTTTPIPSSTHSSIDAFRPPSPINQSSIHPNDRQLLT